MDTASAPTFVALPTGLAEEGWGLPESPESWRACVHVCVARGGRGAGAQGPDTVAGVGLEQSSLQPLKLSTDGLGPRAACS